MTTTIPCKIFLLGGHDLEMLTIKQLLDGRDGCVVMDKNLRWDNAHLSAYQDSLALYPDGDIYGIELQEDVSVPANYHRIDHHNDYALKPSALEQVAEMMGVALNRYQQLVAANDKGYIPSMQALSATDEEIADIRRRDREAQGVSEADEQMAELSVKDHFSRHGSLWVVRSLTPRFSPICDRLYPFQRLLIYTDSEWVFYGEGKAELVEVLVEDIKQKKIYHGGGDEGYVGAARWAYSQDEIIEFVEFIKRQYE